MTRLEKPIAAAPVATSLFARDSVVVSVALGLTLLVRLPFLFWPLTVDEGGYAYTAHWWFRGLTLYSDDLWFDRPQAIFLAYAAGMRMFGESTWAIRLWGALWAGATAYGCFLIARHLWSRREAWVAMILFVFFYAAPNIEGFTANAELFMLLPAVYSAYCLLVRRWASAGLLASLAVLLKPSGLAAIVLGFCWLAATRASAKDWLRFVLAAAPLPLLSVAAAVMTVGLDKYLDAVLWYRLDVNLASGYQPEQSPIVGWLKTASVWGPLAPITLVGAFRSRGQPLGFLSAWLLTSLGGVAMGGHWLNHYFSQLVPALAAGAGAGLVFLSGNPPELLRALMIPVLSWGVVSFANRDLSYFLLSPAQGSLRLYARPQYLVASEVTEYLHAHAQPTDTLYVAFYEADIYHLAGLKSSSPYLYRLDLDRMPGAFERVVQDVVDRKPTFVVDLREPLRAGIDTGRFYEALTAGYVPVATFGTTIVYRRASSA